MDNGAKVEELVGKLGNRREIILDTMEDQLGLNLKELRKCSSVVKKREEEFLSTNGRGGSVCAYHLQYQICCAIN